ncbi:MAG: cob(I)yrinic acid a,c-diamide adenosyltransferase [Betaproteobacteria bacterium]
MGNRLTKITTRTGDAGTTGLGDGTRVRKNALRVVVIGDVDELNSMLGLLLTEPLPDSARATLVRIQNQLFDLGGEICIPGTAVLTSEHVSFLDGESSRLNADLGPLKEFILPGGSRAASCCHLARTIARRAERSLVALADSDPVSALSLQYLNRLSDFLFILARTLNRHAGVVDVCWRRHASTIETH